MKSPLKAAAAAALFTSLSIANVAYADGNRPVSSKTALSAEQEVQDPPVVSGGFANAFIRFDRNLRSAKIRVTFSNLEGKVTRLHLHCAPAGENGPVAIGIVDLVGIGLDNSETNTLDANTIIGKLANNQFPRGDANRCGIYNLESLVYAIDAGQVYWNLHTSAFPGGELRGQVEPLN